MTPIDETLRALEDTVRAGKVRYIGCSNLPAWQIMKALGISEHRGLARFDSVQAYYSIAGRDLEREVVPLLLDQNMGLLVWSPLAGTFTDKSATGTGPEEARRAKFDFPPVDKERALRCIHAMRDIAAAHEGASVARVALAWLLHQKPVTSVIIGAKNRQQLDDNLACVDLKLSAGELSRLDEVSAPPHEYPLDGERAANGGLAELRR